MINYDVHLSPYQEKGVLLFDHEHMRVIVHDMEDLREALFVMNTCNEADQNLLAKMKIKWP